MPTYGYERSLIAVTGAGFNNVSAKYEEPAKLNLHFRADPSGLLHVEKGEAVIETQEEYTVKVHKSCSDLSGVNHQICSKL